MTQKNTAAVPAHLGIILDGNRRWAKANGLPSLEGHRHGAEVFKQISMASFDRGVKYLSAFVFSTENWSRTDKEVGYLMDLVLKAVEKYLDEFHERGIKLIVLGRREGLRQKVVEAVKRAEAATADNVNGTLALCFNYGGQEELVDACKKLLADRVDQADVTADAIRERLYHPQVPDMDLMIRTSGERRTSGFMLYRAAYTELYFTDTYWPDFTVGHLDEALADYQQRNRRFGA